MTKVEVVVLDFDYQNKVVEVSMRESLVESAATKASAGATSAVAVSKKNKRATATATAGGDGGGGVLAVMGGKVQARIELVKPRYCLTVCLSV